MRTRAESGTIGAAPGTLLGDRGGNLAARYHYRSGRPLASTGPALRGLDQDLGEQAAPLPDVLPWDPTMTTSSGRVPPENNGCPPGYFAPFVAPGEPGAVAVPGRTDYALRCRLMATSSPATIQDESGISMAEAAAVYTEAVKDTAKQVGGAIGTGLSWLPWIVIGLAAFAAISAASDL